MTIKSTVENLSKKMKKSAKYRYIVVLIVR